MSKEERLTMYVTKWWSTRGIVRMSGRITQRSYFTSGVVFVKVGTDAFATEEEARLHVRKAAVRKHASLLTQMAAMAEIVTNSVKIVNG